MENFPMPDEPIIILSGKRYVPKGEEPQFEPPTEEERAYKQKPIRAPQFNTAVAERTRPSVERRDRIENKLFNILSSPVTAAYEGITGGIEDIGTATEKLAQSEKSVIGGLPIGQGAIEGLLGGLSGATKVGFGALQAVPAVAGFTAGTTAVGELGGQDIAPYLEKILTPVQSLTQPESYAGKKAAEIADVALPLLLMGGYAKGKKLATRLGETERSLPFTPDTRPRVSGIPKEILEQDLTTQVPPEQVIDLSKLPKQEKTPTQQVGDVLEIKPEVQNATQEGQKPEIGITQYQETPQRGLSPETSDSNKPLESGKIQEEINTLKPEKLGDPQNLTSIKNAKADELAKKIEIDPIEKTLLPSEKESFNKVKTAIESGEIDPLQVAKEILDNKKTTLSEVDKQSSLQYALRKSDIQYDATYEKLQNSIASGDKVAEEMYRARLEEIKSDGKTILEASKKSGTELSSAFRERQLLIDNSYTPIKVFQEASLLNPEGKIPKESQALFEKATNEIAQLKKKIFEYESKTPEREVKKLIDKTQRMGLAEERRTKRKVTGEAIDARIKTLSQDLYKELGVLGANPFANPKAAKLVGELAIEYVKKGANTVEGLVDEVYNLLKDKVKDLDKRQIMDAISGYGKIVEPKTKSEITQTLGNLKKEMKLLSAIEDEVNLVERLKKNGKGETTPRLEELRSKYKELKKLSKEAPEPKFVESTQKDVQIVKRLEEELKRLESGEKTQKEAKTSREKSEYEKELRQKIANIKRIDRTTQKDVSKYQDDITGDVRQLKAQKTRVRNKIAELQKQKEELSQNIVIEKPSRTFVPDKELLDMKTEMKKWELQVDDEFARLKRMNMRGWEKVKSEIPYMINIPRAALATMDMSNPLRQSLPLTTLYPQISSKAFIDMHRAAGSEKFFDKMMTAIEMHPEYKTAIDNGLDITSQSKSGMNIAKAEESYIGSQPLNKIPGLGVLTKASERAAVAYPNKLRMDIAGEMIKGLRAKEITPENNPKAYQDMMKVINWGTGRANLGILEPMASIMNSVMFSPRLFVSRLQAFNLVNYAKLHPAARNLLMKQMVATLAQGMTFLGLAKVMGAQVVLDTRSSDFGKIKVGDTRIDVWGGYQQIFTYLARMASGQVKSVDGKRVYELDGKLYPLRWFSDKKHQRNPMNGDAVDLTIGLIRNKLSPPAALAFDAATGAKVTGEEFGEDFSKETYERLTFLILQGVIEAKEDLGWGTIAAGVGSFYGQGLQTYKPKRKVNLN